MQAIKTQIDRAEYLRLDAASPVKHEFYRGEIFAMAGGTFSHAKISLNISSHLHALLRGNPCRPMNSDMRVATPSGLDTYPDVSVYCHEPELADNDCTLLNPVLIVEVLSPGTRSYDRGDKFMLYRSMPSLRDYLLVESESVFVEHYQRIGPHEWHLHEYQQSSDVLDLASIGQTLEIARFYDGLGLS
ncbi:MAG: Uma2 family endonuclease [Methylococcaceae bacterium]|nr:MAG: Uma2 family endonuclease [Methylococcaceae bacterium]